ncbi:hypothetical protein SISSUDRAFT_1113579 [Sistotremastrum suecicum HHB10207 ss-3]|uniref:Uncharacterized protein n=1 Tax=Sistotremastrum suecicum HHB10207 ss-3 TaxID=1314776 RepID=A0A166EHJ6_9AGAM|nr:hypothetical protein SISSUDRAFT_1113579 [Sistotremastrum suecicum HHB10207 ss-3]
MHAQVVRPPTDYGQTVIDTLSSMSSEGGVIDQQLLRHFLALSPSYLLLDTTTNPSTMAAHQLANEPPNQEHIPSIPGIDTWDKGFNFLVDILLALHTRNELELETLNTASKACSECWTVASSWPGGGVGDASRARVRIVAGKLRSLLDENRRTYRGGLVYVP